MQHTLLLLTFTCLISFTITQWTPPSTDICGENCCSPVGTNGNTNPPCPVCNAPKREPGTQRIRKEVRTLSSSEWENVVTAFWIMKNTSQSEGAALYGSAFKNYDYFTSQHAVTTTDLRGDQGHFSAAFMTWHCGFLLQFENSLLSINPDIGALPYWDLTRTTPSIFTDQYFGSVPGSGNNGIVSNGQFAYWPIVSNWTISDYEPYIDNASTIGFINSDTGYLRSDGNENKNPYTTRWGKVYNYSPADYELCQSVSGYWDNWYSCVEVGIVAGDKLVDGSLHSGPHISIGGSKLLNRGDFRDVVTSPNDPLFMFHHANLDRSKMWFLFNNQEKADNFWGFPIVNSSSIVPPNDIYPGINLNDQMANAWGFTSEDLGIENGPSGLWTHADILCNVNPATSPYLYDDMVQ